jgi:hypothetical protein
MTGRDYRSVDAIEPERGQQSDWADGGPMHVDAQPPARLQNLTCPRLSGPSTVIVWIKEGADTSTVCFVNRHFLS